MKRSFKRLLSLVMALSIVMSLLSVATATGETQDAPDNTDAAELYIYKVGTMDADEDGQPDLKSDGVTKKSNRYSDSSRTYDSKHTIEYNFYYYHSDPLKDWETTNGSRHNHNITSGLFELINTKTGEKLPAYCVDFQESAIGDYAYKRLNLEESTYFSEARAAQIRGIVNNGYWVDWTENSDGFITASVPANVVNAVNAWLEEQGKAPLSNLTGDQALTATQLAIWSASNYEAYKYYVTPDFGYEEISSILNILSSINKTRADYAENPSMTNTVILEMVDSINAKAEADRTEDEKSLLNAEHLERFLGIVRHQSPNDTFTFNQVYTADFDNTDEATANIEKLRDYLLAQEAEPLTRGDVLFTDDYFVISDAVFTDAETGPDGSVSYNVTLTIKLAADIDTARDNLVLKAKIGTAEKTYSLTGANAVAPDKNGYFTISFTGLSKETAEQGISLTLSGSQYVDGVYFYQAAPTDSYWYDSVREGSQNMVGKYTGETPIYVEKAIAIDLEADTTSVTLKKYNGSADPSTVVDPNSAAIPVVNGGVTEYYPALEGVKFDLYAKLNSTDSILVKDNLTTDVNGTITVSDLPADYSYFFKEDAAGALPGYVCDPDTMHWVDTDGTVTVENCYSVGDLTLTKDVEGVSTSDHFTFQIALDLGEADLQNATAVVGTSYQAVWTKANGCEVTHAGILDFASPVTVELSDGESLTIKGVPTGTAYAITETDSKGYNSTSAAATGAIVEEGVSASFTNTKFNLPDTGAPSLLLKKTVGGSAPAAGETFNFELYKFTDGSWEYVTTASNASDGTIAFTPARDTEPATSYYKVSEVAGDGNYNYDTTVFYAKVETTADSDGDLATNITYYKNWNSSTNTASSVVADPTFNNTRRSTPTPSKTSAKWNLTGEKTLDGQNASGFVFQIKDPNGNTKRVTSEDGVISFPTYTYTRAGTYTYTISEVAGDDADIIYDDSVYTVKVTIASSSDAYEVESVEITKDGESADKVSFANTTSASPSSVQWTPTARKTLNGQAASGFTFQIADSSGAVLSTVKSVDGIVSFAAIAFTEDGTYTYTMSEVPGVNTAIIYDTSVYTITVAVADGKIERVAYTKDGVAVEEIVFVNTIPDEYIPNSGNNGGDGDADDDVPLDELFDPDVPRGQVVVTGDSAFWFILAALSALALLVLAFADKKGKRQEP